MTTGHLPEALAGALAGRYAIERELGRGGMATVYLARDLKHDRLVALKVLDPGLGAVLGTERFLAEIRVTANLQHPNILPLFDSGEANGLLFYVMPFVDGESLRVKLAREKQLPTDGAVRIAIAIASALEHAHRKGVVHRDLKPENVLMLDGQPLLADFGIALAVANAGGNRLTQTGLSLGTPQYMSPEQATGDRVIDARSDIYSLGAMLYEMLTGDPPHVGSTAQAVISKVVTERPQDVRVARPNVQGNVAAALERALEKLPADRFESATAFGAALENPAFGGSSYLSSAGPPGTGARATSARLGARVAALAGWAVAIVALGLAASAWLRHPAALPTRRFDLTFGAFTPASNFEVAVSPDGSMLAASGKMGSDRAIFIRHLDGDAEFRKAPGTDAGESPSFSPDNQWIVFRRPTDRTLVKVNINTGAAVVLVNTPEFNPWYPDWGDDGRIVFTGPTGVGIVDGTGGAPRRLPRIPAVRPFLLPDGSGVLWSTGTNVMLYDFKSDSNYFLVAGRAATYVASGHLLYSPPSGGLFAAPFDLGHHRITGPSARVLERVDAREPFGSARGYAVSRGGLLVQHDAAGADNEVVIARLEKSADTLRLPPGIHTDPRFSADGKRIAMAVAEPQHMGSDIYTMDLAARAFAQLTFGGTNVTPVWSPDGRTIAYSKNAQDSAGVRAGYDIFVKPADNSGPERRITSMVSGYIRVAQWIDDKHVLFSARIGSGNYHIFTVSTEAGSAPLKPVEYMDTPVSEREPRLSPDGKLVVYVGNESGQGEVWMRDFPTPRGKWNLSAGAGSAPRWTPDGKAVLFWRGSAVMDSLFRVRIDRAPAVVIHDPELVTTLRTALSSDWNLHPDGQRFIATVRAPSAGTNGTTDRYLIVENWFSELRRLTGANRR